ncbi:MAG: ParB/RepB/Spo0J family partition protein [Clostridia bacterium]
MSKKTRSLGKGLGALLPDKPLYEDQEEVKDLVSLISIDLITPNKEQPRTGFNQDKLIELSESIRENGIIQPIVVTPKDDEFMIIAGERRYRAAKLANIKEVPAIIREIPDEKVLEFALIENIQREDLLPIEEARALSSLVQNLELSKTDLAKRIGKSRSYVSNMVRLLDLPTYIQGLLEEDLLKMGHARAMLPLADYDDINQIADRIVKNDLSVRQVERLVKKRLEEQEQEETQNRDEKVENLIIKEFEEKLQSNLKTKVEIQSKGKKGRIVIQYYSSEELERLISKINGEKE